MLPVINGRKRGRILRILTITIIIIDNPAGGDARRQSKLGRDGAAEREHRAAARGRHLAAAERPLGWNASKASACCATTACGTRRTADRQKTSTQLQRGRRERQPARAAGTANSGDRRSHRSGDNPRSRLPDGHGSHPGRARRDGRRLPGRALLVLHAWPDQQPDHHALQRDQDRPAEHDVPRHGHVQSRPRGDPQRSGLADVR